MLTTFGSNSRSDNSKPTSPAGKAPCGAFSFLVPIVAQAENLLEIVAQVQAVDGPRLDCASRGRSSTGNRLVSLVPRFVGSVRSVHRPDWRNPGRREARRVSRGVSPRPMS